MNKFADTETLTRMNSDKDESRGKAIKQRMEALGMDAAALAEGAGVGRATLYNVFDDKEGVTEKSYRRVENALTSIENQHGGPDALLSTEEGLIAFELTGDFGVRLVVKGPIPYARELEQSVARLIREMRDTAAVNRPPEE